MGYVLKNSAVSFGRVQKKRKENFLSGFILD